MPKRWDASVCVCVCVPAPGFGDHPPSHRCHCVGAAVLPLYGAPAPPRTDTAPSPPTQSPPSKGPGPADGSRTGAGGLPTAALGGRCWRPAETGAAGRPEHPPHTPPSVRDAPAGGKAGEATLGTGSLPASQPSLWRHFLPGALRSLPTGAGRHEEDAAVLPVS